ncbi:MAG: TIGR01777 family oxidoreductase [Ginsengibacter sp.]
MPTVMITGGTGMVGQNLTTALISRGYQVIIMSRNPGKYKNHEHVRYAEWDINTQKIDEGSVSEADCIVHLAGAGVMDKRWTPRYKKEILSSRVKSSEFLVKALSEHPNHVKTFISASAIGWYGRDDRMHPMPFVEPDKPDPNFLGETCRLWEKSVEPFTEMGKRLVKLRFGIVLSRKGGALSEFKKSFRFGIAAILGSGRQVISWIHIEDLCRMIIYAIENSHVGGSYNAVAPVPVSNKELTLTLARSLKNNFFIPVHVPQFFLKLFLGERSIEVLKSATVSDEKIKSEGFIFLYPGIESALKQLTKNSGS